MPAGHFYNTGAYASIFPLVVGPAEPITLPGLAGHGPIIYDLTFYIKWKLFPSLTELSFFYGLHPSCIYNSIMLTSSQLSTDILHLSQEYL